MKTKILTLLFIIGIGLLNSCSSDDDNTTLPDESINGVWNLKNASFGLSPTTIDYNLGDVIWTFNQNATLIVENNIITEDIYSVGLESGTYDYEIEQNGNSQTLYINSDQRGGVCA